MKSAKLEWALDALPEALTLVQEGLTKFQDSDKLWMMKGQLQVGGLKKDLSVRISYGSGIFRAFRASQQNTL